MAKKPGTGPRTKRKKKTKAKEETLFPDQALPVPPEDIVVVGEKVVKHPTVIPAKKKRGRPAKKKTTVKKKFKEPTVTVTGRVTLPVGNGSSRKHIHYDVQPFAVAVGKSRTLRGSFKTEKEALDFIGTLSLKERLKAWVGRFESVQVETSLTVRRN